MVFDRHHYYFHSYLGL